MNHDYPIDPTLTLRLELHRVTDQRDAFQAALHKDVLSLAKAAVEEAVRSTDHYNNIIDTQLKVIEELKAEVAHFKGRPHTEGELGSLVPKHLLQHWVDEAVSLRAEVDALTTLSRRMDETINVSQAECRRLKAENESLMTTPTSRLLRDSRAENAQLKADFDKSVGLVWLQVAENERLIRACDSLRAEVARLKLEIETA